MPRLVDFPLARAGSRLEPLPRLKWNTMSDCLHLERSDVRFRVAVAVGALAFGLGALELPAAAQQQIPGVSVVLPPLKPATSEGAPTPQAAPETPAAAPAATTKPAAKKKPAAAANKPAATAAVSPGGEGKGSGTGSGGGKGGQAIVVLVNDEPITGYEVEQRQRLMGMGADIRERVQANFKSLIQRPKTSEDLKQILNDTINQNKTKTKEQIIAIFEERKKQYALGLQKQAIESAKNAALPGLKKQALEELIDERLKLQEAKRLNVNVTDEDADKMLKNIADRNKMTLEQFTAQLKSQGTDVNAMRQRFRAMMAWNDVIRRRFGHQIAITERDVDRVVAQSPVGGEDQVELQVARITFAVAGKLDQKAIAQRIGDADKARKKFTDCKSGPAAAAGIPDAKFEDLGVRKPSSIPEPTRSMLLNAKDGESLPPSVGEGGVEIWAVCSRKTVKADEKVRTEAQEQLRQKEFELLARRHLKDLRQDAHLEYR